jgi:peptidyl-prolyl cis-trans isomerase C
MWKPLLCLLFPLIGGGCAKAAAAGEHGSGDAGAHHGAVVARVGSVELHEDDLERMMARDPGATPARFDGKVARRELVDGLVRFELLAQAAERAGLTRDPDAIHAQQQIAVTKLVNERLGAAASPDAIKPADVEREYLAHRATDFTLPAAVRVRHLRVSGAPEAEQLAARARALAPDDDRGFVALVTSHTEDALTRSSGGDLGFIDAHSTLPAPIVKAALELRVPGAVAGPIATDTGYEVLRLVTLRAAAVSPLAAVEDSIRQRLYREQRARALDALLAELRKETPVEVVPQP